MKKAARKLKTTPDRNDCNTLTTKAGRRGASSLWYAEHTLSGKQLSRDDVAILAEALADLSAILGGAK